jgi:hypothetical protein
MPVRNRKTSPASPKATNLSGRYGKIGISAVGAAARFGYSRDVKGNLTRQGERLASGERRKQSKP